MCSRKVPGVGLNCSSSSMIFFQLFQNATGFRKMAQLRLKSETLPHPKKGKWPRTLKGFGQSGPVPLELSTFLLLKRKIIVEPSWV